MMSGSRLFVLLEDFEHRLFELSDVVAQQKERIQELEAANKDLQKQIQERQQQEKLQSKKAVEPPPTIIKSKDFGKLVSSNLPDAVAREEVKQKLDAYISDLDRCIAYLSALS